MPAKKAAEKVAKKAAKKTAGHSEEHRNTKDLRRAYEHTARVEILRRDLTAPANDAIGALAEMAQQALKAGLFSDAADLLRGSEHLCFATFANDGSGASPLPRELVRGIHEQFENLTRKADEHWEYEGKASSALAAIYKGSRKSAAKAFEQGAYHRALEFARAAEALAHVRTPAQPKLAAGKGRLQLTVF